jgi:hypothetical protein
MVAKIIPLFLLAFTAAAQQDDPAWRPSADLVVAVHDSTGYFADSSYLSSPVLGSGSLKYLSDRNEFSVNGTGADQPITFSAWVKYSVNSGDQGVFGKIGGGAAGQWEYFFMARQLATGTRFSVFPGGPAGGIGRVQATATATATGIWYHYCATDSGSRARSGIKIYINGVRVDDTDYDSATTTGAINGLSSLALAQDAGFCGVNGSANDFRVYRREFSAAEVYTLYQSSKDEHP